MLLAFLLQRVTDAHAGDGEHDHERQRDRSYGDLREGDVGGLEEKEHQCGEQPVEAERNDLFRGVARGDDPCACNGEQQEDAGADDHHHAGSPLRLGIRSMLSSGLGCQWPRSRVRKARAVACVTTELMASRMQTMMTVFQEAWLLPVCTKTAAARKTEPRQAGSER